VNARGRGSSVGEKIMAAARKLANEKPLDQIGLSEVARVAGVSWPTVKRHVGSKQQLRGRLLGEQPELATNLRDTRTRLLDAAERVVARVGYESATLDDVAAEAGLTKGAVYWHFDSKTSLLLALLERYSKEELGALTADLQGVAGTEVQHALSRFCAAQLSRLDQNPDSARLFVELLAHCREGELRERLTGHVGATQAAVAGLFRALEEEHKPAAELDAGALAALWVALFQGVVLNVALRGSLPEANALSAKAVRLFSRALEPAVRAKARLRR